MSEATELWRRARYDEMVAEMSKLTSEGRLNPADYSRDYLAGYEAYHKGDETTLLRLRAAYCPDDPPPHP